MSAVGLFLVGAFVTAVTLAGLALLVWGAVMDGREQQRVVRELRLRSADDLVDAA